MLGCIAFRFVCCSLLPPVGVEREEQMVAGDRRRKGRPQVRKGQRNEAMGAGVGGEEDCLSHCPLRPISLCRSEAHPLSPRTQV